jgi:hypothetical protein
LVHFFYRIRLCFRIYHRGLNNNNLFFEATPRKIELLRGISRKSRDFGRRKTKHGGQAFRAVFCFSPAKIEIFREIPSNNEIFLGVALKEHVIGF